MRPLSPALFFLVAASLLSAGDPTRTADAAPAIPLNPPVDPPSPAVSASDPRDSSPDRVRSLSPAIAARLAERMPKFTPPNPPSVTTSSAAPSPILADANSTPPAPDLRELDRPRNTIIRLPNYVVQEEKPPAFKERHILTPRGHLALAFKRYPGLRFGSLPFFSNAGVALTMLEEDYRLERKAEMENLAGLVVVPTDRTRAKTEVQNAFLRASEYGYDGMGPK